MLDAGFDAYGYLDVKNQTKVITYLEKWGYKIPEEIKS